MHKAQQAKCLKSTTHADVTCRLIFQQEIGPTTAFLLILISLSSLMMELTIMALQNLAPACPLLSLVSGTWPAAPRTWPGQSPPLLCPAAEKVRSEEEHKDHEHDAAPCPTSRSWSKNHERTFAINSLLFSSSSSITLLDNSFLTLLVRVTSC